jgi:hypothetical protein
LWSRIRFSILPVRRAEYPTENAEAREWKNRRKEVRTRRQVIEVKDESRETVTDLYPRRSP